MNFCDLVLDALEECESGEELLNYLCYVIPNLRSLLIDPEDYEIVSKE